MSNLLRSIEANDFIIDTECVYDNALVKKCERIFQQFVEEGKIKSKFSDDKWNCYSDLKFNLISFNLDRKKYEKHIGCEFGISFDEMKKMMRCFAVYCFGIYIFRTIAYEKIRVIIDFLQSYKNEKYKVTHEELFAIVEFLFFINTPINMINSIEKNIKVKRGKKSGARKLKPVMNYLAIANEIERLYSLEIDEESFIKWFPIYIWVKVSFVVPSRPTEILVTPKDCLKQEGDDYYYLRRRTLLKGKSKSVFYDVNKDYEITSFLITDMEFLNIVKKYLELTKDQERRFLFAFNDKMLNNMYPLASMSRLLDEFVDTFLVDNVNYDFAKYAVGIDEFEHVNIGDSRPIAITNLTYQNVHMDIVKECAGHTSIDTTAGYYTNVSETIMASSVMQIQKKIQNLNIVSSREEKIVKSKVAIKGRKYGCKYGEFREDILIECLKNECFEDCLICDDYTPSENELEEYEKNKKEKVDKGVQELWQLLFNVCEIKNRDISMDDILLNVQTETALYSKCCDKVAERKGEEWLKQQGTKMTSC